ncbi:MAG: FAD-dependent oxidoreductase [Thermoanaerobaculales bacterium]|jgi:protoporphyrinogen oxidase|nr:FAD-dependent oxidoreductase [Thermoanaerobaculales bacterium]
MGPVVIVGGGLTGLVAAERLAAAGVAAPVLEREVEPGGACRSVEAEGFTFDYTGHLLHVARPETEAYLAGLGVWDGLAVHERRAAVVIGGRATPYPVQINTHGLAPEVRRDCLLGFIRAWAAHAAGAEPADFRAWVLERFGEGLAEHFFFPYNSKLYRARPEELSLDWVGRYVPKPKLEDVVDGALGLYRDPVGYNAVFRYPREGGIRLLPDAVAARVPGLEPGRELVALHLGERWLELQGGERRPWERLLATISLSALLDAVVDELPPEVAAARAALRWVRVANVALGVAGPAPSPEHWLYFPDPELPFYRVGFPSNHGRVAPPGCHTVSIELSLDPGPGEVAAAAAAAEAAAVAAGLVDPAAVRVRRLSVIDPAYVVFDHPRRQAVALLRRFLRARGVLLAGRWAEWKYSAMEDAILDGMRAARVLGGEAADEP